MCQLLLRYDANPKILNPSNKTALAIAEDRGHEDVISLLRAVTLFLSYVSH